MGRIDVQALLGEGQMLADVGGDPAGIGPGDSPFTSRYAARNVFIPASQRGVSNTAWDVFGVPSQPYGLVRYQTAGPAVGDYVEWDVVLDAGTYEMSYAGWRDNNLCIVTFSIDGVDYGTDLNLYAASQTSFLAFFTGLVVPTAGRHTFRCEVTGKDAASTNHFMVLSGITLSRTGA